MMSLFNSISSSVSSKSQPARSDSLESSQRDTIGFSDERPTPPREPVFNGVGSVVFGSPSVESIRVATQEKAVNMVEAVGGAAISVGTDLLAIPADTIRFIMNGPVKVEKTPEAQAQAVKAFVHAQQFNNNVTQAQRVEVQRNKNDEATRVAGKSLTNADNRSLGLGVSYQGNVNTTYHLTVFAQAQQRAAKIAQQQAQVVSVGTTPKKMMVDFDGVGEGGTGRGQSASASSRDAAG